MFRQPAVAAVLLGTAWCASCAESSPTTNQTSQQASISFAPLLEKISKECFTRTQSCMSERDGGTGAQTARSSDIHWAKDVYEAIERAKAEDKPIFMETMVSKGGNPKPGCEV